MSKKLSAEAQAILSAADAQHYSTTIELVRSFLADNPTSQRAWIDLGQCLAAISRYDEAESAYQKVIDIDGEPESGFVLCEIGNLYRSKGDFETAITWYQKQVAADPNDAMGLLHIGNVRLRQGNFESAEQAFKQALECDAVCLEETHFALGLVYRAMNRLQESKAQLTKAIELDEKMAEAKVALKDVQRAISLSQKA